MAMQRESVGEIPILLLAAGSSSRMGQSKQLLHIKGKPLLQKTVDTAVEAGTGRIIVVLGSNEKAHRKIIDGYPLQIISNPHWQQGMGSSIKTGVNYIIDNFPNSKAIIISVCDQPFLTAEHLIELTKKYSDEKKLIVASWYKETLGVPILFDRSLFGELKGIKDSEGAKTIIQQYVDKVVSISFSLGEIDLDTMEDYNTFNL